VHHVLLLLVSMGVAAFGTVIGAGGGFLFVPVLMFLYPHESPASVTFISLFSVLANALSATAGYLRLRRVDVRSGLVFGAATVVPAVIGVVLVREVSMAQFSPVFGCLLMALGLGLIPEIRRRKGGRRPPPPEPKPGWTERHFVDVDGVEFRYAFSLRLGAIASVLVGFASSFFGIGGGVIHVPFMTQVLRFPVRVATATSVFVLGISSLVGVVTHVIMGDVRLNIVRALVAAAGSVIGAQIGARIARRLTGQYVLVVLLCALFLVGLRLVLRVFQV